MNDAECGKKLQQEFNLSCYPDVSVLLVKLTIQTQPLPKSKNMPRFCVLRKARFHVNQNGKNMTIGKRQIGLKGIKARKLYTCKISGNIDPIGEP